MTLPEMQAVACPNPAQANVGGTIRRGAILALDLGTSAGWALQLSDGHISTGTVSLKHTRYDGGGMRYLRFRRWQQEGHFLQVLCCHFRAEQRQRNG